MNIILRKKYLIKSYFDIGFCNVSAVFIYKLLCKAVRLIIIHFLSLKIIVNFQVRTRCFI